MGDAIHIVGAAPSRFQAVLLVRDIIVIYIRRPGMLMWNDDFCIVTR